MKTTTFQKLIDASVTDAAGNIMITARDAATAAGKSEAAIYRAIKTREIKPIRTGLYPTAEIHAAICKARRGRPSKRIPYCLEIRARLRDKNGEGWDSPLVIVPCPTDEDTIMGSLLDSMPPEFDGSEFDKGKDLLEITQTLTTKNQ